MGKTFHRKRSLAVVGTLLSFVAASPLQQHHVKRTAREVAYAYNGSPIQSTSQPSPTRHSYDEAVEWLHVHADATIEHPDVVFNAIRNSRPLLEEDRKQQKSSSVRTRKEQEELSGSHLNPQSPLTDAFVDESDGSIGDAKMESNETAVAVGFNVSVDTEFNVTTDSNDTSTVVFTTSEGESLHSNSTNSTNNATYSGEPIKEFRPIRMRAFLSEVAGGGQHLTEQQQSLLLQNMIKPALLSWSAALRVTPVVGNLTVDPTQLQDGVACGPVIVPEHHTTTGVPDTDFILYITVAFADDSPPNATTALSNALNGTNVEERSGKEEKDKQEKEDEEDADALAKNETTPKPVCTADYLAASAFCSTDQQDRPVAAVMHLCLTDSFFDDVPTNIMLVMHELGHSLGFNAISLAHFRRPDGTAFTKRNGAGEIPLTKINCTGPVQQIRTDTVALPSTDILQFRTVRGGVRVAEVVTPSVRQVARNHFDCQDVSGAELESGEFLPLATNQVSCLGDHWERRLFKTDLMNPLVDDNLEFNPRFSTITLAYFADSGWYQVDLSRASLAAGWGRAAGCGFVQETCILDGQVPPQGSSFFCNQAPTTTNDDGKNGGEYTSDIHGCTPDLTRKASCALDSYEGELPPEYQYFNVSYGANVGGNDPFMDYCPVYSGFANGLCSDGENEAVIRVNYAERFGQRNSRCLSGQVTSFLKEEHRGESESASSEDTVRTDSTALCLPIACVVEDRSLRIQVNGRWERCEKKDDIIVPRRVSTSPSPSSNFTIVCPDPIRICPTFYCVRDCLGTNRICDYAVGRCVCGSKDNNNNETNNNNTLASIVSVPDFIPDNAPCAIPAEGDQGDQKSSGMGSFYKPENDEDSGLPSADSPLADYYVPTERGLKEEPEGFWTKRWKGIAAGSATMACLLLGLICYYYASLRRKNGTSAPTGEDGDGGHIDANKHKMIASVVVDMRIHGPNRNGADALQTRDSETEGSMTETEGSFVTGTVVAVSSSSDAASDLEGNPEDVKSRLGSAAVDHADYIDPLAHPSTNTSPVVRRRHVLTNPFAS